MDRDKINTYCYDFEEERKSIMDKYLKELSFNEGIIFTNNSIKFTITDFFCWYMRSFNVLEKDKRKQIGWQFRNDFISEITKLIDKVIELNVSEP